MSLDEDKPEFRRLDDGTMWPYPQSLAGLSWRLRYAPTTTLSRTELVAAADVLSAYRALIEATPTKRAFVTAALSPKAKRAKRKGS